LGKQENRKTRSSQHREIIENMKTPPDPPWSNKKKGLKPQTPPGAYGRLNSLCA